MKAQRGYYSLIQFCPDASRLEAVNVGVVLFCPRAGFLKARTSNSSRRAEQLVGRGQLERETLRAAKEAIERRLEADRASFQNLEDLERFVNTRANWLKLTHARPVKVFDPEQELENLYEELVGGKSLRRAKAEKQELFPDLHDTFVRLNSQGRAQLDLRITVPVLERSLDVPYAFQNGRLNLVKPQRFSGQEGRSMDTAMRLALEGDLVKRHGTEEHRDARLIVLSSFAEPENGALVSRIDSLFSEYGVETVAKDQVAVFVARVEQEAH